VSTGLPSWRLSSWRELPAASRRARGRQIGRPAGALGVVAGGTANRSIYDQGHSTSYLPGQLLRKEGQGPVGDVSVNQAYDAFGLTYKLY
jgi:hypothetical protein